VKALYQNLLNEHKGDTSQHYSTKEASCCQHQLTKSDQHKSNTNNCGTTNNADTMTSCNTSISNEELSDPEASDRVIPCALNYLDMGAFI